MGTSYDPRRSGLEDPRAVLRRHGLRPKKSWGQCFLTNLALAERIADDAAGAGADTVVEIGAGAGTLTTALATRAERVIAIERDRELASLLRVELEAHDNVEILEADATRVDYAALGSEGMPLALAGNLPYHLTGKLIRRIVEVRHSLTRAVVMVQLEVAKRLCSKEGSRSYGTLSVMSQAWFDVERLWRVSPGSFHPPPKVASAVVRMTPSPTPRAGELEEADLSRVVHAAFSARRKTIRNALASAFSAEAIGAALDEVGIAPTVRAETLTVEQLAALCRALPQLQSR